MNKDREVKNSGQKNLPDLKGMIRRIKPQITWDRLTHPPATVAKLRNISSDYSVGKSSICLFIGTSGSAKAMAAEVIANELDMHLLCVDLSAVVSKYIGETEKNLRHVFEVAKREHAVLLFDEADALFGKRSEVKDSHDRYANSEISYLLQCMEAYSGLTILATSKKHVDDAEFRRNARYIIEFPASKAETICR